MLEIKSGENRLGLYPEYGGSIAYWFRGDMAVFYPVTDSRLIAQDNKMISAYPLVPYSNRIAGGKFNFRGRDYQLKPNFEGEENTIHGNGWERPWKLELLEEHKATFVLHHNPPTDPVDQWPFAYKAYITYEVSGDGLAVYMQITNKDDKIQPVGMGFHPYIPRYNKVELGFSAQSIWNNGSDHLPEGRMFIDGRWSFDHMREVNHKEKLDNCYAGWQRILFIRWKNIGMNLTVTASNNFDHLVIYTPTDYPYFTAEPATNMNNAINMPEISDRGLYLLKPNESIKGHIFYSLSAI